MVKSPVIVEFPPEIGPVVTPGAEYTISSKTIAIFDCCVYAFPVKASHSFAPLGFMLMETIARPKLSNSLLALVITLPDNGGSFCAFPLIA